MYPIDPHINCLNFILRSFERYEKREKINSDIITDILHNDIVRSKVEHFHQSD